jgi:hypothetical protein
MYRILIEMETILKKISLMIFLFTGILGEAPLAAFSQNGEVKFEQLSVLHGLSDNRVEAICQDSKGFMWFGTEGGLSRFDGYNFINYGHVRF